MKELRLSLKTKWFEMTKEGMKTEDYRYLTPRYLNQFLLKNILIFVWIESGLN